MNKIISFASLIIFLNISLINFSFGQKNPDDIIGIWLVKGKNAKIQISKNNNKYYGKIIWTNNPDKKDYNNPDKKLRDVMIIGITNMKDFIYNATENKYEEGKIYDPLTGYVYSSYMILKNKNELHVRGYLGISLLGRSENWSRVVE